MVLDDLTVFDFEDAAVRIVTRDGEPWFVAADVCRILDIANSRDAVAKLDEDEVDDVGIADAIGREQRMNIISESGLYALVFTSRKPEAKRFRKWVTGVVLPAIRRHGVYVHAAPEPQAMPDMARQDVSNWLSLVREARLLKGPGAAARIWAQSPLPSLDDGAQPAVSASEIAPVEAFLAACVRVTGDPGDRISSRDLERTWRRWAETSGAVPLSPRIVQQRFAALAGRWRCPETGKRFGRMKASNTYFTGMIMVAGA